MSNLKNTMDQVGQDPRKDSKRNKLKADARRKS